MSKYDAVTGASYGHGLPISIEKRELQKLRPWSYLIRRLILPFTRHRDIVKRSYRNGTQPTARLLVERISPNDPRTAFTGSYFEISEPHRRKDCPFWS